MLLTYEYKDQMHKVYIHWTADIGYSTVFREIVQRVSDKHQLVADAYHKPARCLDDLVDKLYMQLYIFTNEYSGVPYSPGFRRIILRLLSEVFGTVTECAELDNMDDKNPLAGLFMAVADKLREMVDVYLEDNTYQGKHHYRRTNMEQYSETTDESLLSCEFEDVLLQMTELSRLMDCLTDIQRSRFVKHTFLSYTFQEIAAHEGVSKQSVQESVVSALKKIKQQLD